MYNAADGGYPTEKAGEIMEVWQIAVNGVLALISLVAASAAVINAKAARESSKSSELYLRLGMREQIEKYLPWIDIEFDDIELKDQINRGPKICHGKCPEHRKRDKDDEHVDPDKDYERGSARIIKYCINRIDLEKQANGQRVSHENPINRLRKLTDVYPESKLDEVLQKISALKRIEGGKKDDDYIDIVYYDEISGIMLSRRFFIDIKNGRLAVEPRKTSGPPRYHGIIEGFDL